MFFFKTHYYPHFLINIVYSKMENHHKPEEKTPLSIYFIIIILPFLLLYWMVPFVSNLIIGNDYPLYSIQWQMELLFSIKTGSFPLYAPGFAFGHSSSAMTLGQIYHPLTYISSSLPGYWNGKALLLNTLLRLLSLGIAHLALFAFLKKIRLSTLFSFLLSCITVYNLRMLDLFRFGASLETYTGFLFLCTAIAWYFLQPSNLPGPLSIIGATYWLICSGHPTIMYHGILGIGLYLIIIPFFLADMTEKNFIWKDTFTFWAKTSFYIFLGILLSSAYTIPYYFDFIRMNSLRASTDYVYSLSIFETFYGNISNFFMPLFSEIHGAFSSSYLFLIAALIPALRIFRVKLPRSVWLTWGTALFVFLYMEGARTPIHRVVWEYFPFASSVRTELRISIVMPVLIMILLSWLVQTNPVTLNLKGRAFTLKPYVLLAVISLFLIAIYSLLSAVIKPEMSIFSPKYIRNIPMKTVMAITFFGIISLLALIAYGLLLKAKNTLGILLCFTILLHIGLILRYGIFIQERHYQPTFDQMKLQKKETINITSHPGEGLFSSAVSNQMDHSFMEPFLAKIFTHAIPVSGQDEAYEKMARSRLPQQIFIENYNPEAARLITDKAFDMIKGKVDLIYSSYNRLNFHVLSEMPAFFSLSYPFTGYWNAWVNGKQVNIYRANGAAHAVEIPEGESLIEFRYWSPAAFWGMVITSLTFILIGLYVCFISLNGFPRIISAFIVLTIGFGFVFLWNYSLYTGNNLETRYTWIYPPMSKPNIAYGKITSRLPLPKGLYYIWFLKGGIYLNHTSKIVDGNKSNGSGYKIEVRSEDDPSVTIDLNGKVTHINKGNISNFEIPPEDIPSVIIDLNNEEKINSVLIYASSKDPSETKCNSELLISPDQKHWESIASITSDLKLHQPSGIEFESPLTARYLQIKVSGSRNVILDEVEVY
jgi:hypothetical protein